MLSVLSIFSTTDCSQSTESTLRKEPVALESAVRKSLGEPVTSSTDESGVSAPTTTTENQIFEQTATSSSAVAVSPDGRIVAAVNPESNSVTLIDAETLRILSEIPVGVSPRTLAFTPDSKTVLVVNREDATLSKVNLDTYEVVETYSLESMSYGVVTDGARAFVTEFGVASVSVIDLSSGHISARIAVDSFPAGIAITRGHRQVLITHLFTGNLTVVDVQTLSVVKQVSTGEDTNLSQSVAIGPDGRKAYLPQTRSNVKNLNPLFDTTVFPVVNVVAIDTGSLLVRERVTLDTADRPVNMPFSSVVSPDGKTLYLANAGSDDVSVIQLETNKASTHIEVGANPRGIAITPDGSRVFVNNVLEGSLSVIDVGTDVLINTIAITEIPLGKQILLGKRLFNSAKEPLLTTDNWISCATCHFDGLFDARTWLGFPDGPRNTPALFGVGETLPLHWSGDFDELQDVEITIERIQFGRGLIGGIAHHDSLGPPHAGLSIELDALAAYLRSIRVPPSPFQDGKGAIERGRSIFDELGCQTCHVPPLYIDRQVHSVGTGDPAKERNPHGRSTYFDTPSLRGLWLTAPYFHDGSATTLLEVFRSGTVHNVADHLSSSDLQDLISFMRALPFSNSSN
jgi:YVTN family beta-propeller protein